MTGRRVRVRGVVQGVGFRPFVYRAARTYDIRGWVRNSDDGVEIHAEGEPDAIAAFLRALEADPPPAARIDALEVTPAASAGAADFTIRPSRNGAAPTTHISPDLPVCEACLAELFDPADRRYGYPYITCSGCGPRHSIVLAIPYDRAGTTMRDWPMCATCAVEFHDPANRRFHAQPIACPECGPHYALLDGAERVTGDAAAIAAAAARLAAGGIVAIKGIGGYHLACAAADARAVAALRARKVRKERPFALMVRDLDTARRLVVLSDTAEALLRSPARPVVLAEGRVELPGVAPDTAELGLMLPYAPLHHLLFAAGAPAVLVLTSANRSSEPIAYEDADACERLAGIADAFLVGERPIARRVDDSVVRAGSLGPAVLRRARGWAPGAVAAVPAGPPVLGVGADLKNAVALAVRGEVVLGQHLGDLEQYAVRRAFTEAVTDLLAMFRIDRGELVVAHDAHPGYASTAEALALGAAEHRAVQHHRAHVAAVLAEHGALDRRVVGLALDGTGYGDDGTIWGGEIFVGSAGTGFIRAGSLRPAQLPGGDAAARWPAQAAAGYLAEVPEAPEPGEPPFGLPARYDRARRLLRAGVRCFVTSSAGRLFDAAAALLGFTREVTFEGQAAMWLEQLARRARSEGGYPCPYAGGQLDWRPLLAEVVRERRRGRDASGIARRFHAGLAAGVVAAARSEASAAGTGDVVLAGGVFQNDLLVTEVSRALERAGLRVLLPIRVPPNDGGIALGQAALASLR